MGESLDYTVYSIRSKHFGNFEFYPLFADGRAEPALERILVILNIYFPAVSEDELFYLKIAKSIISQSLEGLNDSEFYIYSLCNRNLVFHKFTETEDTGQFYDFLRKIDKMEEIPNCNHQFYESFLLKKL